MLQPGDVVVLQIEQKAKDDFVGSFSSEEYRIESMGTIPLGPTYGRVKIAGHNVLDAEDLVKKHLSEFLENPQLQLTLKEKRPQPFGGEGLGRTITPVPPSDLDVPVPPPGLESDGSKRNVLYDGKTFDEWRELLKIELKPESRVKCIKALGAFGHVGHGKEVTEIFLELVGQEEWRGDFRLGFLGEACWKELQSRPLPAAEALPVLLNAVDSKNPTIKYFLTRVLQPYARHDNKQVAEALKRLQEDPDLQVPQEGGTVRQRYAF